MIETQELIEKIQSLTLENHTLTRQLNAVVSSNEYLLNENKIWRKNQNIYDAVIVVLILIISVIISAWLVS